MNSDGLTLTACETCPPDQHVIRAMRVLGTTFDPPIAAPGGAVTVRAITADVEPRDVDVAWYRCPTNLTLSVIAGGSETESLADVFAAQATACIARGAFAHGVSVRVPIDADGGALDAAPYRTARRWTDLVGFACANGSIVPAPASGVWPRCTGTRGVVFTASIPGPTSDGATAAPPTATLQNFSLTQRGATRAWGERDVPEVPACDGTRRDCPAIELRFDVAASSVAMEIQGPAGGNLGAPDDSASFVNYHVTAMAPSGNGSCDLLSVDTEARSDGPGTDGSSRVLLHWVPSSALGEVTFWFTARRYSGGLSVARRTVVVR